MKTYLLIGAGPGIGLATAKRFAKEGFRVVLASRTGGDRWKNTDPIHDYKHEPVFERVDASDSQAVVDLIRRYESDLEVVHYNAGVLHYKKDGELKTRTIDAETATTIDQELRTNLTSALIAIKATCDVMASQKTGTILITGGGFGVTPVADFINISVAKAGIRAAVEALHPRMKERGINLATVTVSTLVAPGSRTASNIGEAFWNVHSQPQRSWKWETVFQ